MLLLLDFILERIDLITIQILALVSQLFNLFTQNAILLDLVFELLLHDLQSGVSGPRVLFLGLLLHLLENGVELVIQQFELLFERVVLAFLLLDELQPQLTHTYISATRPWYFFIIRRTPYFDSSSLSPTTISLLIVSKLV
jgi:hypothetical protein